MTDSEIGPFRPQGGESPPHLVGRDREQGILGAMLAELASNRPMTCALFLYGPPGYGKTALLRWVAAEAEAVRRVETQWLHLAEAPDTATLFDLLAPRSWWWRFVPASAALRETRRNPVGAIKDLLTLRTRRRALVLLLDEANRFVPEVGAALLNAVQIVGARQRLLLVLAGAPDLRDRLLEAKAPYRDRGEVCALGRLDAEASAEAIRRPLADDGISITEEALERLVAESHGYPFFLQLQGEAVWKQAAAARRRGDTDPVVTIETVEQAAPGFDLRKREYCFGRYREMENAALRPVAEAVAEAFAVSPTVSTAQLHAAIAAGLGDDSDRERIDSAKTLLQRTGFVWRHDGDTRWEPGIPGVMDGLDCLPKEVVRNTFVAQ